MDSPNAFYTVKELRQRLSISTTVFWQHQPVGHAALEALAAAGIRKIELAESREQFDMTNIDSMKLIGEACRSCGIEVAAYHAWPFIRERVHSLSVSLELPVVVLPLRHLPQHFHPGAPVQSESGGAKKRTG